LKKQRVNISIQIAIENFSSELSYKIGKSITSALNPETRFITCNEKIKIYSKNGVVFINITTHDLQSMRAIINTYLRLLSLSYLSLNL
jgi:tRNA threonylcarbamoyladenosine modification (KEOPS) complex  Pcc1 subunit